MSGQQPLDALRRKKLCQSKIAEPKPTHKDLIAKTKEKFKKTPDCPHARKK